MRRFSTKASAVDNVSCSLWSHVFQSHNIHIKHFKVQFKEIKIHFLLCQAQGNVPPLAYHSCSMFRGELFVLGGVFPRPNPQPDGCSDSLYIFDPNLSIWYQPILTGDKPSPRSGYHACIQTDTRLMSAPCICLYVLFFCCCFSFSHSACVIQERYIYVFGGWDTPVCYNDMYMLDLGEANSCWVTPTGSSQGQRIMS